VSALSETVYRELEEAGSSVGISVLCPAAVATDILNSGRHRPSRLGPAATAPERDYPPLDDVMQPAQAADIMFAGLRERRFWILTHPEQGAAAIRGRAEDIVTGRNPGDESVDPNFTSSTGRKPSRNAAGRPRQAIAAGLQRSVVTPGCSVGGATRSRPSRQAARRRR
jgi:hypothetical protein